MILLALSAILAAAAPAARPAVNVYVVDAADILGAGPESETLKRELRARLAARKLRLVDDRDLADAVLEIREAAVAHRGQGRTNVTGTGRMEPGPPPRFGTMGTKEHGIAVQHERDILLSVRVTVGDRFADLSSHPSEPRIGAAAKDVARQVDRWIRSR